MDEELSEMIDYMVEHGWYILSLNNIGAFKAYDYMNDESFPMLPTTDVHELARAVCKHIQDSENSCQ